MRLQSTDEIVLSCSQSPWAEVKKEMTEEKGLQDDVADKIGEYVKLKGGSRDSTFARLCLF